MTNPSDRDHRGLRKYFSRSKNKTGPVNASPPSQSSRPDLTSATSHQSNVGGSTSSSQTPAQTSVQGSTSNVVSSNDVPSRQNALWRRAYDNLRKEDPDLIAAYETLASSSANLNATNFTAESIELIAQQQKTKIKNKQWTYPWFGKPRAVRDTVESILSVVSQASGLISTGMSMAPPFVSLPWSMVSILIPFVMEDFKSMQDAVDGLKEVTSILASYNYADREYLVSDVTRNDYEDIVMKLYSAIFAYEAAVALYFAKNTLKRLGFSLKPGQNNWSDALETVKNEALKCNTPLHALSTRLSQKSMLDLQTSMQHGFQIMSNALQQATAERNKRERIMQWLSPIDVAQDHSDIQKLLGEQYLGSGRWLIDDEQAFRDWRNARDGVFHLRGTVGTGKSSLTSIVIEHLLQSQKSAGNNLLQNQYEMVAFFYCSARASESDFSHSSRRDANNIIRSLLAQCVLQPDGSIARRVQEAYDFKTRHNTGECDLNTLKEAMLELSHASITFVIDALDECNDLAGLFSALAELTRIKTDLRIFVSSRPGVDLSSQISPRYTVSVDSKNHLDISTYIEGEIQSRYRSSSMTETQAKRLARALVKFSNGLFRWVVLEINLFLPLSQRQGKRHSKDIELRLGNLETSNAPVVEKLFDAYEEIYDYAMGDEDELTRQTIVNTAMKSVLCAIQPLSVTELALLIWLRVERIEDLKTDLKRGLNLDDEQQGHLDSTLVLDRPALWRIDSKLGLQSWEDDILEYCSNFIVKSANGEVRLAHLSVRQYFETRQKSAFSTEQQHLEAALNCTLLRAYMVPGDRESVFEVSTERSILEPSARNLVAARDGLTKYVYGNWFIHAHLSAISSELTMLLDIHGNNCSNESSLDRLKLEIARKADLTTKDSLGDTTIHRAVRLGLIDHIDCLLRTNAVRGGQLLSEIRNNAGHSPLYLAVFYGRFTSFARFLNDLPSLDIPNSYNATVLQVATTCGRAFLIAVARSYGHDMTRPDKNQYTLPHYATYFGHKTIVEMLLTYDCRFDILNAAGQSALDLVGRNRSWIKHSLQRNPTSTHKDLIGEPLRGPSIHKSTHESMGANSLSSRPRIVMQDPDVLSCNNCDLPTWVEGSKDHLQYTFRKSELGQAVRHGCPVCTLISETLFDCRSLVGKTEPGTDPETDPDIKVWVDLDRDAPVKTGRDCLRFGMGAPSFAQINLSIDAQDQDLRPIQDDYGLFAGRHVPMQNDLNSCIRRIREWQATCHDTHVDCHKQDPSTTSKRPPRLIDVGHLGEELMPRVIRTELIDDFHEEYAYLSYRIEAGDPEQHGKYMEFSEEEAEDGIELTRLSQGYRDAMMLCRDLGYRYLWIDVFCWHSTQKISRMGSFVAAASLVIASTSADITKSLFDTSETIVQRTASSKLDISFEGDAQQLFGLHMEEGIPSVSTVLQYHILNRTWRIGEVYLAQRLLIISDRQAYWICTQSSWSESSFANLTPVMEGLPALRASLQQLREQSAFEESYRTILDRWYSIVEKISSGYLSRHSDRLRATMAIVQSFATMAELRNDQYLRGLWKSDFAFGLLWKSEPFEYFVEPLVSWPRLEENRSWSWASIVTAVSYTFLAGLVAGKACNASNYFKLLEVETLSNDDSISEDLVSVGYLKISTLCHDFSSSSEAKSFEYFLDNPFGPSDDLRTFEPKLDGTLLILVAVWRCKPDGDPNADRWMGLVIRHDVKHDWYLREGIFIGPRADSDLSAWQEMEIKMM